MTNSLVFSSVAIFIALYFIDLYVDLPITDYPSTLISHIMFVINVLITFTAIAKFTLIYTSQMEYKYVELHNQADFDQLTGLGNRYYMNDILQDEELKSTIEEGYSVAIVDIDHFKQINDTFGHDNGDIVLREIAEILSVEASDKIKVGRWGGEEFLIIATHEVKYDDFLKCLENLREQVSKHQFNLNNQVIYKTVSIGASHYNKSLSVQDVIKNADNNLYSAKESGRNNLVA
ncbi:MAG: GGDEF domain-containing protein [Butyrivibrio sp.]|nr:GGDEF domain-containing protein [Butyrivibrio sp.]